MMSGGKMNQKIACFQEIVFVSACAVELEMVEDKEDVFKVMRKVLASRGDHRYFLKLTRGAKWVTKLISSVSKTKWVSSSWDILCLGRSTITIFL
jgi:hypothetical protein